MYCSLACHQWSGCTALRATQEICVGEIIGDNEGNNEIGKENEFYVNRCECSGDVMMMMMMAMARYSNGVSSGNDRRDDSRNGMGCSLQGEGGGDG